MVVPLITFYVQNDQDIKGIVNYYISGQSLYSLFWMTSYQKIIMSLI